MTAMDSLSASPAAQDLQPAFCPPHTFRQRRGKRLRAYDIELGGEVALKRVNLAALYHPAQREFAIETARTEIAAASGASNIRALRAFAG